MWGIWIIEPTTAFEFLYDSNSILDFDNQWSVDDSDKQLTHGIV